MPKRYYKQRLSSAIAELRRAEAKLLNVHLDRIRRSYLHLTAQEKQGIIYGLESLISKIQDGTLAKEKVQFDKDEAKRIRLEQGLSQHELVTKLFGGYTPNGQKLISFYESGRADPTNPRSPTRYVMARQYIEWLKAHGYAH